MKIINGPSVSLPPGGSAKMWRACLGEFDLTDFPRLQTLGQAEAVFHHLPFQVLQLAFFLAVLVSSFGFLSGNGRGCPHAAHQLPSSPRPPPPLGSGSGSSVAEDQAEGAQGHQRLAAEQLRGQPARLPVPEQAEEGPGGRGMGGNKDRAKGRGLTRRPKGEKHVSI